MIDTQCSKTNTSANIATKSPPIPGSVDAARITLAIAACIGKLNLAKRSSLYDAHDLVQEVWVRLLSNGCSILKKYDAGRGTSLEYYVSMIARREASNLLRKEKAVRRGSNRVVNSAEKDMDEFIGTIPEPILEARDSVSKLSKWLTTKGISRKGIDILHSTATREAPVDIADRLGVTIQIVYNWQHRIRALSRLFKDRIDDSSGANVISANAGSG